MQVIVDACLVMMQDGVDNVMLFVDCSDCDVSMIM